MSTPTIVLTGDSMMDILVSDIRDIVGPRATIIDAAEGSETVAQTTRRFQSVHPPQGCKVVFFGAHKDARAGHADPILTFLTDVVDPVASDWIATQQQSNFLACYGKGSPWAGQGGSPVFDSLYNDAAPALATITRELAQAVGDHYFPLRDKVIAAIRSGGWVLDAESVEGLARGLMDRRLRVPSFDSPADTEASNTGHLRLGPARRWVAAFLVAEMERRGWIPPSTTTQMALLIPSLPSAPSEYTARQPGREITGYPGAGTGWASTGGGGTPVGGGGSGGGTGSGGGGAPAKMKWWQYLLGRG